MMMINRRTDDEADRCSSQGVLRGCEHCELIFAIAAKRLRSDGGDGPGAHLGVKVRVELLKLTYSRSDRVQHQRSQGLRVHQAGVGRMD
eukprot:scaffold191634_cov15-Prasinocladus_malaysianus.AAC.1